MRQVVDLHPRFGSVPIEGIEIDPLSRDCHYRMNTPR